MEEEISDLDLTDEDLAGEEKDVTITWTEKNKMLAIVSGFSYYLDKKRENKHYWKCSQCYAQKCPARLKTETDGEKHNYMEETKSHCLHHQRRSDVTICLNLKSNQRKLKQSHQYC